MLYAQRLGLSRQLSGRAADKGTSHLLLTLHCSKIQWFPAELFCVTIYCTPYRPVKKGQLMAYIFMNVNTGEIFHCEDREWIDAFDAAKTDGWVPDGTLYDAEFVIDEELDYIDDENQKMFTIVNAMRETFVWEGSYTDKCNQIVTYEDSIYLAMSIKSAGITGALLEFIQKGSFRICSD